MHEDTSGPKIHAKPPAKGEEGRGVRDPDQDLMMTSRTSGWAQAGVTFVTGVRCVTAGMTRIHQRAEASKGGSGSSNKQPFVPTSQQKKKRSLKLLRARVGAQRPLPDTERQTSTLTSASLCWDGCQVDVRAQQRPDASADSCRRRSSRAFGLKVAEMTSGAARSTRLHRPEKGWSSNTHLDSLHTAAFRPA